MDKSHSYVQSHYYHTFLASTLLIRSFASGAPSTCYDASPLLCCDNLHMHEGCPTFWHIIEMNTFLFAIIPDTSYNAYSNRYNYSCMYYIGYFSIFMVTLHGLEKLVYKVQTSKLLFNASLTPHIVQNITRDRLALSYILRMNIAWENFCKRGNPLNVSSIFCNDIILDHKLWCMSFTMLW